MKNKPLIIILFFLGFFSNKSEAINIPVKMRYVCSVGADNIVNWFAANDACGSFISYNIYGSPDGVLPYSVLTQIPTLTQTSYTHTGASTTCKYFIVVSNLCNGDSAFSDTVGVDDTPPAPINIDSISVDPLTGNIYLGWHKGFSNDIAGYLIGRNLGGGQNTIIGTVADTSFVLSGLSVGDSSYSFWATPIDSCGRSTGAGSPHTSILLKSSLDDCNGIININWTPYIGWSSVQNYEIWVSRNGSAYSAELSTAGSVSSGIVSNVSKGDLISIFVRAINPNDPGITSSSNADTINIPLLKLPKENYLNDVTVNSDNKSITVSWVSDTSGVVSFYKILRGTDITIMDTIATVPFQSGILDYSYIDNEVDPTKEFYYYKILVFDNCQNYSGSTSNISNSIKVTILKPAEVDAYGLNDLYNNVLYWNAYNYWKKGVWYYEVFKGYELAGKYTWLKIAATLDTFSRDSNIIYQIGNTGNCYYVVAREFTNDIHNQQESHSAYVCESKTDTIFFPTAFNPFGINRKWQPKGVYINYEKSVIYIYDRWGQLVKRIDDIHDGWDGKNKDGEYMEPDTYFYYGLITGVNREKRTYKGQFVYLR